MHPSNARTTTRPFAWALVLPVALVELAVQLAFANGYGYHRDELYFRTVGRHPAFGYDDQPPLTPLLGRLSEALFGETPRGVRVVSALAVAIVVVLVALLARELGAGRRGQLVAAGATAASGFVVVVGHLLSTSTFDLLLWTAVILVVAMILGGRDPRLWLAVGLLVGIGLQNKHLILLLVLALAAGLALDRRLLEALRSRWLWLGAALAVAIWLPNLLWQATNGWPQLELAQDIREDEAGESRATLVPFQLLVVGPLLVPILVAGLWGLVRDPTLRPWRSFAFAYPALLVLLFVAGAKPYYVGPLVVCLLAPGAVVVERWLQTTARAVLVGAAIAVTAAVSIVVALPVIPADRLGDTVVADVNEDAIETVGWPALARTVADVYDALPERERATAVIFTGNYGEAGAIDRYGPELGLPRAYSGHNAYARFGIPEGSAGPVIVLSNGGPTAHFRGCRPAATIDNGVDLENEEQGRTVFVCEAPHRPWREAWADIRHLDA